MSNDGVPPASGSSEESVTKRQVTHSSRGYIDQVRIPNVIVMVGLPARGKTYISKKLCRYLKWVGIKTKVFNVGEYRRTDAHASDAIHGANATFFSPNNQEALRVRQESAQRAMDDMAKWLESEAGQVAIFDATNTTRQRRSWVVDLCEERGYVPCPAHSPRFRCFFIESVCDDQRIIESNVTDVKVNSPDYKGVMTAEQAKDDFMKRIDNYKAQYEPLCQKDDSELFFIKIINAGRSFFVNRVIGHIQSRVIYFLMNIHLLPRSIYITRHGESEYNTMGRMGGDSPLTARGQEYANALAEFFKMEHVQDLRVWCSQKIRAAQTARELKGIASHIEYWKALDEIDAGICEGLTYQDIAQRYPTQADDRIKDKYHYRFPSGESYEDVVARLEPVIMELERQTNVLVLSHSAVLRCILAYFSDRPQHELPFIELPLHTLVKLTPRAYTCDSTIYTYDVDNKQWTNTDRPLSLVEGTWDL